MSVALTYRPPSRYSWSYRDALLPKHLLSAPTLVSEQHHDLGLVDKKGRTIGARVTIDDCSVEVHTEETSACSCKLSYSGGTRIRYVTVQPTRDKRDFGASQDGYLAGDADDPATTDRVTKYIARRLATMTKRYTKQIEKGRV